LIEQLPRIHPLEPGRPAVGGPDHPMRKVTQQVAFEPDGWTPDRAAKVAALFDSMAADWHTRENEDRLVSIDDALERGALPRGRCLEVGSGTGHGTKRLAGHFEKLVALDLSIEMLRRAPPELAARVQADSAKLPFADDAFDVLVLVNALLMPAEVDRVLAPGGAVLWVSALAEFTPIYLPAEDVEKALPGEWNGRAAEAGWGSWCVLRRSGED